MGLLCIHKKKRQNENSILLLPTEYILDGIKAVTADSKTNLMSLYKMGFTFFDCFFSFILQLEVIKNRLEMTNKTFSPFFAHFFVV